MEDIHKAVVCKPYYIVSHTVVGASNAGSYVDTLEWETSYGQSHNIVADACDYHKCNTSAGQDFDTSSHRINLNPELDTPLNKIHDWLTKIICNGQRMPVLDNTQK